MARAVFHKALALIEAMQPMQARLLALLTAVLFTGLVWLALPGPLNMLEERLGELGWRLAPETAAEERITIVAIDEKSLEQVGPWPWPRETLAEITRALNEAGAQLQVYDIVFPEAREGDAQLQAALESAPSVLAQVPVLQSEQPIQAGMLTHPLQGIGCAPGGNLPATGNYLANHAGFSSIPKGHITPIVADDGAIREVPAVICVNGEAYPALALGALLTAGGRESWGAGLEEGAGLFGPARELRLEGYPGLAVPLNGQGNMRISYKRAPGAYRAISAVDLLNGEADTAMLENTWALVGVTAFGLGDIVPTPYSGSTPGIELQARMLGSLLDTSMPYTPRAAPYLLALLGLAFAGVLLGLAAARERVASIGLPAAAVLLPAAALTLHVQLLSTQAVWLGWLPPALFGLFAASLLMLVEHSRVRSERSRVYTNLSSYLPSDIAQEIAYSLPSSAISARRRDVTLLSADLRNFAAYGEARPPEESAALLHYFFTHATRIIERHHGRVHEFRGDGLLAAWDGNNAESAEQALEAALELQQEIRHVLPQTPPAGLEPLALGIGIEQGPALIGSIGPAHRRSYTLLGDTVTITIRIQEMTAELAQPILVGECAARQLGGHPLESQGSYLLSGLRTPHVLFAPQPLIPDSQDRERPSLKVLSGGRS